MDSHELALLSAHVLKSLAGRDVALLVRADTGEPVGWARTGPGGATRGESCCVEAFRAKAEAGFPPADLLVYTTVRPTVMCLGMGIRAHARAFVFIDGGRISFLTCDDLNLAPTVATNANLPPVALPWLGAFAGTAAGIQAAKGSIAHAVRDGEIDTLRIYHNELTRGVAGGGQWLDKAAGQQLVPPDPPLFNTAALQVDCSAPATPLRHRMYMLLTSTLLHMVRRQAVPQLDGKNVSCVLVGPTGRVLSWAVNNNTGNTTRHAETNCLLSFLAQSHAAIPDGSFLYTSLESCEMCAGMLATVAPGITVVFATPDPGIGATALRHGINGASQTRYVGPAANPLVRKKFQNIVHRAVAQSREQRIAPQIAAFPAQYDTAHPPPNVAALPGPQKGVVMKAHNDQKRAAIAQFGAHLRATHVAPVLAQVQALPQSITTALDMPGVAAAFGVYAQEFFEYARDLLVLWNNRDLSMIGPGHIGTPAFQELMALRARRPEARDLALNDIRAMFNCLAVCGAAHDGALLDGA